MDHLSSIRDRALGALGEARRALGALQWGCDWRVAPQPPAAPASARPDTAGWPTFGEWHATHQPGDAWLYATLSVPAEAEGVALDGSPAALDVNGWHPFTLYVDGKLIAQEERPWLSTGPALLPLPEPIHAGRSYQVTVRLPVAPHGVIGWFAVNLRVRNLDLLAEELETIQAELQVAEALAECDADRDALAAAYAAIDCDALAARQWGRARTSFESAEEHLLPFSERAKAHTVQLLGHSHIDMNWMWTWEDTVACVLRDFHSVAELMRDYPELTFTHSQVPTYQVAQEKEDLWAEVRRRVAEGRWEVVAGTWVEGDLNMANGEAIARHFLYAVRWCRRHLGVTPRVVWEPDTFGHPGNMPQLVKLAGIERYFHMRTNPGLPGWWPLYWWEGMDGSRILCASRGYNGHVGAFAVVDAFRRHRALGSRLAFHIHGVGDHGGGPVRANLETMRRLQRRPVMPTLTCGTMAAFTDAVLREGCALPVHRGESGCVFEGCYTSHADIKRFNREGENALLTAETLALLTGTDDRAALGRAWQHVLFNQFHDLLDGSGIHAPYDQCAEKHAEVMATAGAATQRALAALAAAVDTRGEGQAILVANPSGWARTDVVRVAGLAGVPEHPVLIAPDGARLPGQRSGDALLFVARNVPALGHATYHLAAGAEAAPGAAQPWAPKVSIGNPPTADPLPASPEPPWSYAMPFPSPQPAVEGLAVVEEFGTFRVETPVFRARVAKDSGILVGLFDKRCGRELVGHGMAKWGTCEGVDRRDLAMNVFQVLDEAPHGMTSWELAQVKSEENLIGGATVSLAENGPVRVVLRVERPIRSSKLTQEIIFYRDLERVDFETVVDWQEVGTPQAGIPNLKVAFNARLLRPQAWFEIPYGAVERPADGQEVPALRWADVSGDDYGIALLNDCKYGCDVLGGRLRLSLVRSPYDPDPAPDCREHRFRYSLFPHAGTWREADTVRQGIGFNQPLLALAADAHAGSRPATQASVAITGLPSVILSSVKCPEEGEGAIARFYESQGRAGSVTVRPAAPVRSAEVVNLLEETLEPAVLRDGAVELSFGPWEVKTLRLHF